MVLPDLSDRLFAVRCRASVQPSKETVIITRKRTYVIVVVSFRPGRLGAISMKLSPHRHRSMARHRPPVLLLVEVLPRNTRGLLKTRKLLTAEATTMKTSAG